MPDCLNYSLSSIQLIALIQLWTKWVIDDWRAQQEGWEVGCR